MRISIRALVVALFVLFTGSVGAILLAQRAATETEIISGMQSILVNVSDGTIARSEAFLSDAREDAVLTAGLISSDAFATEEELDLYLGRILATSPSASGAFFGGTDGDFVFVSRSSDVDDNGYRTKAIRIDEGSREVELIYRDSDYNIGRTEFDPEDLYVATERPWYRSAVLRDEAIITDPYVFFSSQEPGVTTALRVDDSSGRLLGVVGIDTNLSELSAFLGELSLGENGSAFIFNRAGEVIALGGRGELQQPDGEGFRLTRVDEIDEPIVSLSFDRLQATAGEQDAPQFFVLDSQDSPDHVFVAPIGDTNWMLGVSLSESDFLANIRRNQRDNVVIAAFIGLIGVAISALLIRNVTRPLSALRRRAAAVEGGTLPADEPIKARITELQDTADAFDHMITGLAEQEEANRNLLGELESRVRDRTSDLRQQNEVRRAAELRAEEASEAKSRFLASMSHEIRTPLNAIIGFSDLTSIEAFGPVGDERYIDFADEIKSAASHLVELVSDILDLAQIEADELQLAESTFDLADAGSGVVGLLGQLARAKGVVLTHESAGPAWIHADERRIKQVAINVINNAIKFTPEGGSVRTIVDRTADGCPRLRVVDTGPGMAPHEIERALAPFGQVGDPIERDRSSTGLGLPISVALVEAHGGSLVIASDPGVGTTVEIELPPDRNRLLDSANAAQQSL